ncbi:Hsp20/alpha crystallin family protein [Streptomyces sp. NPDC059850]|uniref:Hsp20/alpha crystallin family protein n=1 Tax=Streptomyces sp. NPDC059850 TaxID=3346970 RepID=UPI00366651BC
MPVRRHRGAGPLERPRGWSRNPLAEFDELLSQMGGLLESTVGAAPPALTAWAPAADVTEADDAYRVEVDLPGVRRADVDVEVSGQELTVSGEIGEREREGVLRRSTRRTGRFEYRMLLPAEVNTEAVKAGMTDGVLTITVPKAEAVKPRHVEITESGEVGGKEAGGRAQAQQPPGGTRMTDETTETQSTQAAQGAQGAQGMRDTQGAQGTQRAQEAQQSTREAQGTQEAQEFQESREAREAREARESREADETRPSWGFRGRNR